VDTEGNRFGLVDNYTSREAMLIHPFRPVPTEGPATAPSVCHQDRFLRIKVPVLVSTRS
jgi:hypothetical protein